MQKGKKGGGVWEGGRNMCGGQKRKAPHAYAVFVQKILTVKQVELPEKILKRSGTLLRSIILYEYGKR